MTVASTDPPLRQLSRLRAEMTTSASQFAEQLFPGRAILGITFGIVARRCLPDWVKGDALVRPGAAERAITVRQIALSLGAAPETIRRHVNDLCKRGAVSVSQRGVALNTAATNEALVARYLFGTHDILIRFIEDAGRTCDLDLPVGETTTHSFIDVIERAIDLLLLSIDTFRPSETGYASLLWGALTAVAVRDVTFDPVLARRYATAIPPDEIRLAISLRRLAEALFIPYATAWRHMQILRAHDLVTRLANGQWTVLTRNLQTDGAVAVNAAPSSVALRKMRELALLGLDPADAAALYRAGRPALANLGLPRTG